MSDTFVFDSSCGGFLDDQGVFHCTEEYGSDEQLGNYADEVANGEGFYDREGKFHRFHFPD